MLDSVLAFEENLTFDRSAKRETNPITLLDPIDPISDQGWISPHNIDAISSRQVMRIKKKYKWGNYYLIHCQLLRTSLKNRRKDSKENCLWDLGGDRFKLIPRTENKNFSTLHNVVYRLGWTRWLLENSILLSWSILVFVRDAKGVVAEPSLYKFTKRSMKNFGFVELPVH